MKLITDRTESDVLLDNEKGRYGIADLNRVEQAVAELRSLAVQLDIYPKVTTKTDWTHVEAFNPETWPTAEQMARYLGNVHALCNAFSLKVKLPETMQYLTFAGANEIENALLLAYRRVRGILSTYQYSGECYAGEENIL